MPDNFTTLISIAGLLSRTHTATEKTIAQKSARGNDFVLADGLTECVEPFKAG